MFWFSLQLLSETLLILRRTGWEMIKNVYWYPLFLLDFNDTWIFSTDFRKILKYQISWKSVQWEPDCSMRMDGRTDKTDMMKLIVAFRNFANAPHKKYPNLLAISFLQELPNNSTAWGFYICITSVPHFMIDYHCRLVRGLHVKKYKYS